MKRKKWFLETGTVSAELSVEELRISDIYWLMVNYASNLWQDEEGSAAWLLQLFQEKDRLKESFLQTGDFSAISGQPAVPCHNIQVHLGKKIAV